MPHTRKPSLHNSSNHRNDARPQTSGYQSRRRRRSSSASRTTRARRRETRHARQARSSSRAAGCAACGCTRPYVVSRAACPPPASRRSRERGVSEVTISSSRARALILMMRRALIYHSRPPTHIPRLLLSSSPSLANAIATRLEHVDFARVRPVAVNRLGRQQPDRRPEAARVRRQLRADLERNEGRGSVAMQRTEARPQPPFPSSRARRGPRRGRTPSRPCRVCACARRCSPGR